ncbi:SNARE-associated protein Snapin-like isoform X2 [Procambarus clarkii]|uniref:SNARE-associated protein Snapin-like isoform X2 n=1 Tax=Procambarus clarkii TaxID=6728 RepID=UPI001E678F8E|nr:SNARE-associated protein Snapin-like [Procambarus clarkii]
MADTESSCTSVDDRTEDLVSPTRDALVDGIVGLLKPCLDQLDDRVRATRVSQSELHQQLEGLAAELSRVQEQTRCPLQLDAYIKKLQNAKRRVVVVNNILQNTQDRLNKLHSQVNKENARRRALLETTSPLSNTPSTSLHAP